MIKKKAMLGFLFFLPLISYSQSINTTLWKEDINQYKINLEKYHIDLYSKVSAIEFEKDLERIISNLSKKSELDIIIDLMKVTRKIGDGHTSLSLRGLKTHVFPIEISKTKGRWRVIKTTLKYKDLLGLEVLEIDGKKMSEIEEAVSEVAQYVENEYSKEVRVGQYAMVAEVLHGIDVSHKMLEARFTFGEEHDEVKIVPIKAISYEAYTKLSNFIAYEVTIPEVTKPLNTKHDFLWFSAIKSTDAIYIKFESYPSFDDMEVFAKSVLQYCNTNIVKQLVIDLRNNGGGDFFVGTFLAYYLNLADSINWKSGVYVLTDNITFSAAASNAVQFRQMLNATIVGKPTGSNPTGYQDMGEFKLPNSGIIVTYSKRLFKFQEQATQGVQPDVFIPCDWGSYSKGKDSVFQWVIHDIRKHN